MCKQLLYRMLLMILALLLGACSASGPMPEEGSQPDSAANLESAATPHPALDQSPSLWFAPLPPIQSRGGRPFFTGSDDFINLFTPDAPWTHAAEKVDVFKLYGEWVEVASDEEIRQVVQDLERRGIALAVEVAPLVPEDCGGFDIEGFASPISGKYIAGRIQEAGGTIDFLAFDEPFAWASLYDGGQACHWPPEKIASDIAEYMADMREIFPDVVEGDLEPLWLDINIESYMQWLEAYEDVTGEPMPYFFLGFDFARETWAEDALELEQFARAHGVRWGMIYSGDYDDPSDEIWLGKAEERVLTYENALGGRPDMVLLQSFHDHPDFVLPETAPFTFTNFINRYSRAQTQFADIAIDRTDDPAALTINGRLEDTQGASLAGEIIEYTVIPRSGAGVYGTYSVTGIVPEDAIQGNVGYRINDECGCSGSSDFSLYGADYREEGDTDNRLPNGTFQAGLSGWGLWGEGTVLLETSDRGAGTMLHVVATPAQTAGANSNSFPVTPGATFTFTIEARVSPDSTDSGYFALFFLSDDTEILREQIQLTPAPAATGTGVTRVDGSFSIPVSGLPPDRLFVVLRFAGSDDLWPTEAERQVIAP